MGLQLKDTYNLLFLLLLLGTCDSVYAIQTAYPDSSETDTLSQKYGFVHFEVEPDTVFLYLDNDYRNLIKLRDGETLKLSADYYRLLIFGKDIPDRILSIEVKESEVDTVGIRVPKTQSADNKSPTYAAYRWNANIMLFSDSETLISIDGSDYFSYGSIRANLPPGVHRVRFESITGESYDVFLEVNSYQLKTYEKYFKPVKSAARFAGVIPGVSQFYKKQPIKGFSAIALMGITAGLTLHYDSKLAAGKEDFMSVRQRYDQAGTEQLALELGNQLDEIGSEVTGYKNRRNIFRVAVILVYAANFVDAFREPENGYARRRTFNPYRDFSVDFNPEFVEARVQINF